MLSIFNNSPLRALEQTAIFAEHRHQLLAGNIANIDTPGYQPKDLSVTEFRSHLAAAIEKAESQKSKPTSTGVDPSGWQSTTALQTPAEPYGDLRNNLSHLVRHDGTALSMEHQVTEMAKNQHSHQLAVSLMRNQFQILRAAISERVI